VSQGSSESGTQVAPRTSLPNCRPTTLTPESNSGTPRPRLYCAVRRLSRKILTLQRVIASYHLTAMFRIE